MTRTPQDPDAAPTAHVLGPDAALHRLLAMGVPYPLAREAIASTALDRDPDIGTHHLPEDT